MQKFRKELGLSRQDLALMLKVSSSAISMYEKGFRHLSPKASEKWTELQLLWQENRKKGPLPRGIEKKIFAGTAAGKPFAAQPACTKGCNAFYRCHPAVGLKNDDRLSKKLNFLKGGHAGYTQRQPPDGITEEQGTTGDD